MNNLPILSSKAHVISKATANHNVPLTAIDLAALAAQPFGEVLAKQISDQTSDAVKKPDPGPKDVSVVAAPDPNPVEANKPDPATPLPTDLLAALLPQSPAIVAAQVNLPTQVNLAKGTQATKKESSQTLSDLGQSNAAKPATDVTAESKPTSVLQASVPAKSDVFAIALNHSADKVSTDKVILKNTELGAQPPLPSAATMQSMTNLHQVAVQAAPLTINTPVTQERWGDEFSQKITWLASSNQDQSAELHLNPPQLGPMDVVLKVSGDQATALFTSPHAAVREAIEQSIPKLREMLADNGIMLGNTLVSDQSPRDQRGEFGNQRQTAPSGRVLEVAPSVGLTTARTSTISRHNGSVDTFA